MQGQDGAVLLAARRISAGYSLAYPDQVTPASLSDDDAAARARAWRDAAHAAVCDVLEPWSHGTVVRATSRPSYWAFNVVRVEEDPADVEDAVARAARRSTLLSVPSRLQPATKDR